MPFKPFFRLVVFLVFAGRLYAEIVIYNPNNLPAGPNPPVDTPYTAWTSGAAHYNASLHSDTLHSWGPKTMMFVYVRPTDGNVPAMKTPAQLQAELDNTSQFYFDESFRRAWFGTKVINPGQSNQHIIPRLEVVYVDLPGTVAYYFGNNNFGRLTSDTFQAVRQLGGEYAAGQRLDPNNFDRIQIFGDPKLITSTGLANVRGRYSWSGNTLSGGVVRHELGHNWGVFHANNWIGVDGIPRNGVGTHQEYMDGADIMGGGSAVGGGGFNTMFKHRLHFLHELSGDVAVANSSGEYRIFAHTNPESNRLETRERGVLVPVTGTSRFAKNIFLGFRHTYTPGGEMTRNSWDSHAVTVHANNTSNTGNNGGSHLIDTSPCSREADDRVDAAIKIGRTYSEGPNVNGTHIYGGMHITSLERGSLELDGITHHYIDVRINFGSFPGNQPPTASFSDTLITGAVPGEPFTLTVEASDPDDGDLAFDWSFGDDGYNLVNDETQTYTWTEPGVFLVTCVVSDMKGGTATAQTWVNVGNVDFQEPAPPAASMEGLNYRYYHGSWSTLPDFERQFPVKEGTVGGITLAPRERNERFGFVFEGFLDVPTSDVYGFHLRSNDGARLWVGGKLVVENDGLKAAASEQSGNLPLNAGQHPFRLEFFHNTGSEFLSLEWSRLDMPREPIPGAAFLQTDWSGLPAPQVTVTSPLPGEEFLVGRDVLLSAEASAAAGVESVRFFANGIFVGEATEAPFSVLWENVSVGEKTMVAVVTDADGQRALSAPLDFMVNSPPPTRVISINFAGSNSHAPPFAPTPLDFAVQAGAVYAESFWNNFTRFHDLNHGPVYTDLIDNAGFSTPIHTEGSGHIHNTDGVSNANTDTANGLMMRGNIYVNGGQASPWLTVHDVHFAQYDVYLYFDYKDTDSSDAAIRRFDVTTPDGGTFLAPSKYGRNSLSPTNGAGDYPNYDTWVGFKESTATDAAAPNAEVLGNYVVFRNLTSPSFRVAVHDATGGTGGRRFKNGMQIVEVPATIPNLRLSPPPSGWSVTRGGLPVTYLLKMSVEPDGPVTVQIDAGETLSVSPQTLVFTSSDWQTPRAVTLHAVEGALLEGTLTHSVSAAGNYAGVVIPETVVTILDNELPSVSVHAVGRLREGSPGTAAFVFTREGAGDLSGPLNVDFQMSGSASFSGDYSFSGASVSFNTATGAGSVVIPAGLTQVSLTVSVVNDSTPEYGEDAVLTVLPSASYHAGEASAWIFIEDNDATDYQVEIFNSASYQSRPFYLNNKSITYVPEGASGYRVYTNEISEYPSGTSGFSTFSNSATASGQPTDSYWTLPLAQPFTFFGETYDTVYVSTEGSLTFGAGIGDYGNSTGWMSNMFREGYPRIAPLFGRFSINVGGSVRHRRIEEGGDSRTVIFYDRVRIYNGGGATASVQAELFDDGRIRFSYVNVSYTQIGHVGIASGVEATMPTRPFQTTTTPRPFYQSDFRLYPSLEESRAPWFVSEPSPLATVGETYSGLVQTAHPEPSSFGEISLLEGPVWLTLSDHDNGTATLSGMPTASGTFDVILQVADGALASTQSFVLLVVPAAGNTAPVFTSLPSTEAVAGELYGYNVTAMDADGHALAFYLLQGPGWLTLTDHGNNTATLSGTAPFSELTAEQVVLGVSDGLETSLQQFNLQYLLPPAITLVRPLDGAVELVSVDQELYLAVEVDGRGNPVEILWSQESGSAGGAAVFEDSAALETWVSFSAPGRYILRVEADNGQGLSQRMIEVFVAASGDTVLEDGLQGHWRMEETEGTHFMDSSGNNRDATITGNVNPAVSGYAGSGMGQIGSNGSFARVEYAQPSRFTVSGWFYIANSPATGLRTAWAFAGGNNARFRMHMVAGSSRLRLQGNFNTNGIWETEEDIPSLTWLHVAVTYDSTSIHNDPKMYINGSPVNLVRLEAPAGSLVSTNNFRIGSNGGNNSSWNGRIDEVRVYDRIVPAEDIPLLMTPGRVNQAPDVTVAEALVDSGPGQSVNLGGAVTDDGLPEIPGGVETLWEELSGPAPGELTAPMLPAGTYITGLADGVYALRLTADDGAARSGIRMEISVTGGEETPPAITAQPQPVTVTEGQPASFSVTVTGNPPPTFQWRKDGVEIDGATASEFTIAITDLDDAGNYDVVVSNSEGTITSDAAVLTVNPLPPEAPVITQQPQSQTVTVSQPVSFSVSASGHPAPWYQWFRNGEAINGATSATYEIASAAFADAGDYTVFVDNGVGDGVLSEVAVLTVTEGPTAPVITGQPVSVTATEGDPVQFSVVATGNPAPTYQWRRNGINLAGANSATLDIAAITLADAGNYDAVVSNSQGVVISDTVLLTVNPAPSAPQILEQPQSQSVVQGSPVSFSVVADGFPEPAYQWRRNGVDIAGAQSATFTVSSAQFSDAGAYTVFVDNGVGEGVISAPATLTVTEPPSEGPVALGDAYVINGGTLDQTGTGSDGVAFTSPGQFRGVVFNLQDTVELADEGDYIELTFSVVSFASNNNNPWAYRFGIFDNGGTPVTADNQTSVTDDWRGFFAIYRTTNNGTNETNNAVFQQGQGSGGLAGTPNVGGGFGGDPSNLSGTGITKVGSNFNSTFRTDDASFTAVFRLERTSEDLEIITTQFSDTGATVTRTTSAPATWQFNALAFAHSGNFTVDVIEVMTNTLAAPPPVEPPPAPENLAAEAVSSSQIDLTWSDPSGAVDSFRVERSEDTVTWEVLTTVAGPAYSDTGLQPDSTWHYRVIALNAGGESVPSSVVYATTAGSNQPPVAHPQTLVTSVNTPMAITLTGTDPDGHTLTYAVMSHPANGNLTGSAPNLIYTPDTDFEGADSFTFTVSDGEFTSVPATISLSVVASVEGAPYVFPSPGSFDRFAPLPPYLYSPPLEESNPDTFMAWANPADPLPAQFTDYGIFRRPVFQNLRFGSHPERVHIDTLTAEMNGQAVADRLGARQFFTASNAYELGYYILFPDGYDPDDTETRYPVLIVNHGAGGLGATSPSEEIRMMATDSFRANYPAIVISPTWMDRPFSFVGNHPTLVAANPGMTALYELIDHVLAGTRADADRVYATGFSMGAGTTWYLLYERPDLLAAASPWAGNPGAFNPERAAPAGEALRDTAIWMAIGDQDFAPDGEGAINYRVKYEMLRGAGHGALRYWEIPGADHNHAYQEMLWRRYPQILDWMFAHSRGDEVHRGFMHIPHDITVETGEGVGFEGWAFGRPEAVSYEWRHNGTMIPGAVGPRFAIDAPTAADAGDYTVTAFFDDGDITSPAGTLTVLTPASPVITSGPANATVLEGGSASFTVTVAGSYPRTYAWTVGGVPVPDHNSATLTLDNLQLDGGGTVAFTVTNPYGGASASATLTVNHIPPTITGHPQSVAASSGSTLVLTATVSGSEPLTYQWQKDGVELADGGAISGSQTPTLTIHPAALSDSGNYTLVAANPGGSVTSNPAEVSVLDQTRDGLLYLLNFTHAVSTTGANYHKYDTGDLAPLWQRFNLKNGSNPRNYSNVPLKHSGEALTGDPATDVTVSIQASFTGNMGGYTDSPDIALFSESGTGNDGAGPAPRFDWFNPAHAELRQYANFSSNAARWFDYTFSGFDPADTVTFEFVLRSGETGTRTVTVQTTGTPADTLMLSGNVSSDTGSARYLSHSVSGAASYSFRLTGTAGWPPTFNAIGVRVVSPAEPPPAPENLVAEAVSSSRIELSWTDLSDSTDPSDAFRVERSLDGQTWLPVATVSSPGYSDTGLASHTWYSYRVIALRDGLESAPSAVVSARTWTELDFPDEEGNGIDDRWEAENFPDGELPAHLMRRGVQTPIRDIFIAGLDPHDEDDVFEIGGIDPLSGLMQFEARDGREYRILGSQSLGAEADWQELVGWGEEPVLNLNGAGRIFLKLEVRVAVP